MKLSPEKRNQLVLACIGVLAVLAVIWFLFISPRNDALQAAKTNIVARQQKLDGMNAEIKKAGDASQELAQTTATLSRAESDMAGGDPNVWIYDLIRHFKENYKVDISVTGQASVSDMDLLPDFPYRQLRVSVSGTAFYHDLGHFIADFENTYPHIRLVNLSVEPVNDNGSGEDGEKLAFRMDVVALIKGNEPQS